MQTFWERTLGGFFQTPATRTTGQSPLFLPFYERTLGGFFQTPATRTTGRSPLFLTRSKS
jgi:hypothetical protein